MTPSTNTGSRSTTRSEILTLLQAGLETSSWRFTRQAALAWLSAYPGDLEVNLVYARALMGEGRHKHAVPVLQKILGSDPEYLEAALLAEKAFMKCEPNLVPTAAGVITILGGSPSVSREVPTWAAILRDVRLDIEQKHYGDALEKIFSVLGETSEVPLVSLYHLQVSSELDDTPTLLNLARLYRSRWPECIQIGLIQARALMDNGEDDEAVNVLHFCASKDPAGQVPTRLWGNSFAYKPLYPQKLKLNFDLPVPAEVAGRLGLNVLATGPVAAKTEPPEVPLVTLEKTEVASFDGYTIIPTEAEVYPEHPKVVEEVQREKDAQLKEVEHSFQKVAREIGQPVLAQKDERFPVHVLLSMKQGLVNQFNEQSAQVILESMKELARTVEAKIGWSSIVFLPDDLTSCGKYNITPVDSLDPWKIKLALVDLDKALEKTGQRIGSLLIVGGDKVVPFHRLPNPTDDSDADVPSDSPYGALDTNYFVSDWAVGRLPGEDGGDSGLLVSEIRGSIQYHKDEAEAHTLVSDLLRLIFFWDRTWVKNFSNIGYSASVWRRSSLAAFRPVGEGRNLFLSPGSALNLFDPKKLTTAQIGYFNVHGIADGKEWYGQKDPLENSNSSPDFPVALKPADLNRLPEVPRIVFSEACYGGHVFNKQEEDSIALTLLGKGVKAFIGSTTISYGSVNTPLIGADLLGNLVMKNLNNGVSIGSALVIARADFVREMNRRQSYLDGEDQKTLISFVLYGDPLVAYDPYRASKKPVPRDLNQPLVKTISDSGALDETMEQYVPKMVAEAKAMVKGYLPGIDYAEVRVKNRQVNTAYANGVGSYASKKGSPQPERVVVSFSKQVTQADLVHRQYARVTLNKEGKVMKLVVSR